MAQAPTRATPERRGSIGEKVGVAGVSLGTGEFARELASADAVPRLESIERFSDERRWKIGAPVGRTSSGKMAPYDPLRHVTTRYDCYDCYDCYDFMVGGHRPGHV